MPRHLHLKHQFVRYIPEQLEPGVIYISMEYATAVHCCCCGCSEQVVTPFGPTDWKLTFDGETISLWPSIGNWNFSCRSHYIIRRSLVIGRESWKNDRIVEGREWDKEKKQRYYDKKSQQMDSIDRDDKSF
jgi:hypothetical protein